MGEVTSTEWTVLEGMMAEVIVRDLDDEVIERLRARAALHGRTLEEEAREILSRAAPLTPAEKLAIADRIRAMTPRHLDTDSADLIREDRDTR